MFGQLRFSQVLCTMHCCNTSQALRASSPQGEPMGPSASPRVRRAGGEQTRLRRVWADEGIGPYEPGSHSHHARRGGIYGRPSRPISPA